MTTSAVVAINRNDGIAVIEWHAQGSCYAEVSIESFDKPGQLIEQVIGFAYDILGADRLDVRVLGAREEARSPQLHCRLV